VKNEDEQPTVAHGWVAAPQEGSDGVVIKNDPYQNSGSRSGWTWTAPNSDSDK